MSTLISASNLTPSSFVTTLATTGLAAGNNVLFIVATAEDSDPPVITPGLVADFVNVGTFSHTVLSGRLIVTVFSHVVPDPVPVNYTVTSSLFNRSQPCALIRLDNGETLGPMAATIDAEPLDVTIDSPSVQPASSNNIQLIWLLERVGAGAAIPINFTPLVDLDSTGLARQNYFQIVNRTLPNANATAIATWTGLSANYAIAGSILIAPAVVNVTVDTAPTEVRRGETGVIIGASGGGFGAVQGVGSVHFGGEPLTVTAWSDTSITVNIDLNTQLQHDTVTGYQFEVLTDMGATANTGDVDFLPRTGYGEQDLNNPDTSSTQSIVYGYTGDVPVTGDEVEYTLTTLPDGIVVENVTPEGYVQLASMPNADQTISRRVIQADGTIGAESLFTFVVAAQQAPVMPVDATLAVDENQTAVGTFPASSGSAPITYTKSGVDESSFNIDASTGNLTFVSAPDFEIKNQYLVTVTATNGSGSDSQNLTVNINDLSVVINNPGNLNASYAFGSGGLSSSDQVVTDWLALFTNSTSNDAGSLPTTLTEAGSPYSVTFSAPEAVDVVANINVFEDVDLSGADVHIRRRKRLYKFIAVQKKHKLNKR